MLNIKKLQRMLTTAEITLDLPSSITNLLMDYALNGDIELEKFVSNSLREYLSLGSNPITSLSNNTVTLILRLPWLLVLKLWWNAQRNSCTISQIAAEALGFSIPIFLDEIQAQEDYRLELSQEE
jgi:hypothetical protein